MYQRKHNRWLPLALVLAVCLGLAGLTGLSSPPDNTAASSVAAPQAKEIGNSNPLYTQHFGADPWAMEYDGRLYVYMTADTYEYKEDGTIAGNSYKTIASINVISSADLVNWTDHGSIPVAGSGGVCSWATNSWAPSALWKTVDGKDKFYLYFTNSGGGGIGVLVGDSPIGPWTDPNGGPIVSYSTPNCSSDVVPWCFDPCAFIDDDGSAYLYFGGGIKDDAAHPKSARVVRLKDNLTEIDGIPQEIDPPFFYEASAMHKRDGKYYYTYSANFSTDDYIQGVSPSNGSIGCMIADDPMGPFVYSDQILANPSEFGYAGGNNHQCAFSFKGDWYIAYHTSALSKAKGVSTSYRSTQIDKLVYNDDGTIQAASMTKEGVPQLGTLDPYAWVEAETIAWNGGCDTVMEDPSQISSVNLFVTGIRNGNWISVAQADFGEAGADAFTARVAGKRGGTMELRLDSPDPDDPGSTLVGSLTLEAGDGTAWTEVSVPLSAPLTGIRNLFMTFVGDESGEELFDFDRWQFTPVSAAGSPDSPEDTGNPVAMEESARTQVPGETSPDNTPPLWIWIVVAAAALIVVGVVVTVVRKRKA